jgi:mono/diheme cytochrome c family protein
MPFRRTARRWSRLTCASLTALLIVDGGKSSAEPAGPVVPGFQRFYAVSKADSAAGGRLLLSELICTSCHRPGSGLAAQIHRKQAPILDGVGSRVDVSWLRKFLANPQAVKPGTTMPRLFAGLSEPDRKQRVEALVHFLASTGSFRHTLPNLAAAQTGRKLFHEVGCFACHGSLASRERQRPEVGIVPLGKPGEKYNVRSLTAFLLDPLKTRPSGRMPKLNLTRQEADAIAAWFLRDVKVPSNLAFKYYEGRWGNLPDFSTIKPKASGGCVGFNVNLARRQSDYALRFEGFLQIARAGQYTFYLNSDDGSKLYLDGKLVVNNDGEHAPQERSGRTRLTSGPHKIIVDFAQLGGGAELRVEYRTRRMRRRPVALDVTSTREIPKPKDGFKVDPSLAAKGRELFATVGCASCHELRERGKPIASKLAAKPLSQLNLANGCTATAPNQTTPFFGMTPRQRTAIAAAIRNTRPATTEPASVIRETMVRMNCFACHSRGKTGGPTEELDQIFATTTKEMGREGRIPPPLDGVGDKLTDGWLKHVLANGADDRPYMLTKMPNFGEKNVGYLAAAFANLDRKSLVKPPVVHTSDLRLKAAGRKLVGDQAFACIKCHTFGKYKATGIQSLDLTQMTTRIREDWFRRYMMNPIRYRPGTRMPTPFPGGISTMEKVLDGQPATQLSAMWTYLKDGTKARTPTGLVRGKIQLRPTTEPIIYRNFIQGLSPRGIAVGYPGGFNLGFDADEVVLGLLWHGAFIDAGKHWQGRGSGFQSPLGDHVLSLHRDVPFAALESIDTAWPSKTGRDAGYKFTGYRLNKKRQPIFRYRFGSIEIEDFPQPVAGILDPSLKRTLTLRSKSEKPALLFLAATGTNAIKPLKDGWYQIDNRMQIRVTGAAGDKLIVRKNNGRWELLLPVTFKGNVATVTQECKW